jgi:hypothetical protein
MSPTSDGHDHVDEVLEDSALESAQGGAEIFTGVLSLQTQQALHDQGSSHQTPFPRMTSGLTVTPPPAS